MDIIFVHNGRMGSSVVLLNNNGKYIKKIDLRHISLESKTTTLHILLLTCSV
jgi:hypothetical protein